MHAKQDYHRCFLKKYKMHDSPETFLKECFLLYRAWIQTVIMGMHSLAVRFAWQPAALVGGIFESALFAESVCRRAWHRRFTCLAASRHTCLSLQASRKHVLNGLVNGSQPLPLPESQWNGRINTKQNNFATKLLPHQVHYLFQRGCCQNNKALFRCGQLKAMSSHWGRHVFHWLMGSYNKCKTI